MEKMKTAIIGGGAAGLVLASALENKEKTVVFERGERVGKKLAATGNGQGNVSNLGVTREDYFSFSGGETLAKEIVSRYDDSSLCTYFENAGVLLITDERGRIYPAGRQASALGDALRNLLSTRESIEIRTKTRVCDLEKTNGGFVLCVEKENGEKEWVFAETVVLCAGGTAAKSFGTDGSAYALAQKLGHTITQLYPSLVQLKADTKDIKTLKGIRVPDATVTAYYTDVLGGTSCQRSVQITGDIMFADYGVSGDAIFRLSPFLTHRLKSGVRLSIDFLPSFTQEQIYQSLVKKQAQFSTLLTGEIMCGFVNNQIARVVMKRANGDLRAAARLVKAFTLEITGHMGFDLAQVTKGGIRMDEVDENLQSKKQNGLYFAGEMLDIDGQCGGYNLQWAYASARCVAAAIDENCRKQGGQV